ncbi:hypothetical protein F5Y18DRAFT_424907 [Xylariaceae sp. FL1019]|nr:hypothetical protein F5Y18DRAFT_424907 [Xylariaceae sp. FL1019]
MAHLENSMIIAKTMWHFDFSVAPRKDGKIGMGTGLASELNRRMREASDFIDTNTTHLCLRFVHDGT